MNTDILVTILFLLVCNLATHANNHTAYGHKFDSGTLKSSNEIATYIVYFGPIEQSVDTIKQSQISRYQNLSLPDLHELISSNREQILKSIAPEKYQIVRSYKAIPAVILRTSEEVVVELGKSALVKRIGLDTNTVKLNLDKAIKQANIDVVKSVPLSGGNIEIAVIDSGIEESHPDLSGKVLSTSCFSTDCQTSLEDQTGHGTMVSGIIASSGVIASEGASPNVGIHMLKLANAENRTASNARFLAALDHIINELPNVKIVNMSFGSDMMLSESCDAVDSGHLSVSYAVNQLHQRGVTLFASSGNDHSRKGIGSPACLKNVISVGGVWSARVEGYERHCSDEPPQSNVLTCFSNSGDNLDIVAPAAFIVTTDINQSTATVAGTSFASPLVASCAALLLEAEPDLTPAQLKHLLTTHGGKVASDSKQRVFPTLDCWQSYLLLTEGKQPTMSAITPSASLITSKTELSFLATAYDEEDGDLSEQITWWVNEVETQETGEAFNGKFELGNYVVTARVTDTTQIKARASWGISIVEAHAVPPVVSIESPISDSRLGNAEPINVVATAIDEQDGDISASIQWTQNGIEVGKGKQISKIFSTGNHTLKAFVTDSHQNATMTEVFFIVEKSTEPKDIVENSSGGGGIFVFTFIALACSFRIARYGH